MRGNRKKRGRKGEGKGKGRCPGYPRQRTPFCVPSPFLPFLPALSVLPLDGFPGFHLIKFLFLDFLLIAESTLTRMNWFA